MRGEGKGKDQMDHGTWPCTLIKTRPQQRRMKSVSDAADPCKLLNDKCGGVRGERCLLQLHLGD